MDKSLIEDLQANVSSLLLLLIYSYIHCINMHVMLPNRAWFWFIVLKVIKLASSIFLQALTRRKTRHDHLAPRRVNYRL